jgi:hypothetical protein
MTLLARTYSEYAAAQEFAIRLRGACGVRIERTPDGWMVSWGVR